MACAAFYHVLSELDLAEVNTSEIAGVRRERRGRGDLFINFVLYRVYNISEKESGEM